MYTRDELVNHQLTKWVSSIFRLLKKDELTTTEIYKIIKEKYPYKDYYPDKSLKNGATRIGLNRRTVLDHLNCMHEHGLLIKRIDENTRGFWKIKEDISIENFTVEEDKFLIDLVSGENLTIVFPEHRVNIYGLPNKNSSIIVDKGVEKKIQDRLKNAVRKIKDGMNEIQYARFEKYFYHMDMIYRFILRNKIFPKIDRRLISIPIFYSYLHHPFVDKSNPEEFIQIFLEEKKPIKINLPCFILQDDTLVVDKPGKNFINILKSNYKEYQSKTNDEMIRILQGHHLDPILSNLFIYATIELDILKELPMIAIARSETLYDIVSGAYKLSDLYKIADSLKINRIKIEDEYLHSQFDEDAERKYSFQENAIKINKKNPIDKCPICGEKTIFIKNIHDFLDMHNEWLT